MPQPEQEREFGWRFPDALLFTFPKPRGSMARDYKWLGSYRYGIIHLGGRDPADLQRRCEEASHLLGWQAPYVGCNSSVADGRENLQAAPRFAMEAT